MADAVPLAPLIGISRVPNRMLLRLKSWLPSSMEPAVPLVGVGLELPTVPGDVVGDTWRVHCLGPAEWLMIAAPEFLTGIDLQAVERELSLQGVAVVDESHGLAGFALLGPAASEVLSRGCGIDFHPASFPIDRCRRTRLAQIPVVIVNLEHTSGYELYVARSHAEYLFDWLSDAALEQ